MKLNHGSSQNFPWPLRVDILSKIMKHIAFLVALSILAGSALAVPTPTPTPLPTPTPSPSPTMKVKLAWNAPEPGQNVVETRIFKKEGSTLIRLGSATQPDNQIEITGLSIVPYVFVATFVDSYGLESAPSAEAVLAPPSAPLNFTVMTVTIQFDMQQKK